MVEGRHITMVLERLMCKIYFSVKTVKKWGTFITFRESLCFVFLLVTAVTIDHFHWKAQLKLCCGLTVVQHAVVSTLISWAAYHQKLPRTWSRRSWRRPWRQLEMLRRKRWRILSRKLSGRPRLLRRTLQLKRMTPEPFRDLSWLSGMMNDG